MTNNRSTTKKSLLFETFFSLLFVITIFSLLNQSDSLALNPNNHDQAPLSIGSDCPPVEGIDISRFSLTLNDFEVANGKAFIENIANEILIVDVSDPQNLRVKSRLTFDNCYHFIAENDFLYVFSTRAGQKLIQIFNVSDPANPVEIQSFEFSAEGSINDVFLLDDTLFFTLTNDSGNPYFPFYVSLLKIDLETLTSPVQIYQGFGFISSTDWWKDTITDIICQADTAFIAVENNGLVHINLTDNSVINEYLNKTYNPVKLAFHRDYLFLTDRTSGIKILDYTTDTNISLVGSYVGVDGYGPFAIADDYLYVSYEPGGVSVLDISDVSNITKVSQITYEIEIKQLDPSYSAEYATDVIIEGNYLFIGEDRNDLLIFDITTPQQPVEVKLYNHWIYASLFGSLLLVGGFFIFDHFVFKKNKIFSGDQSTSGDEYESTILQSAEEKRPAVTLEETTEQAPFTQLGLELLHIGLIIFIAQNALAAIILSINLLIPQTQVLAEPFYFITIPLVLDIIVGLFFIMALSIFFNNQKEPVFLTAALGWLLWIGLALFYRIYAGMPGFSKLYAITWNLDLDINYPYGDTFLICFFFILNLIAFWFALYYTDKSINILYQESRLLKFTFFGSINLVIGVSVAFVLLLIQDIYDFRVVFLLILLVALILIKLIMVPIIGVVVSVIEQQSIKKRFLSTNQQE